MTVEIKMSGRFIALCLEEPMELGLADTREAAQAMIDAYLEDEDSFELEFGVFEMSAAAARVQAETPYLENCPVVGDRLVTIREYRTLLAAGEVTRAEDRVYTDAEAREYEHTTEVV